MSSAGERSGTSGVSHSFAASATAPAFEAKTENSQPVAGAYSPTALPTALPTPLPTPEVVPANRSQIDRLKIVLETKRKRLLVTALESASLASLEDDELYVEFTPDTRHLRDTLAKSDNVKILRDACHEVRGRDTGVRIVIKDQSGADNDAPPSREDEQRLEKEALRAAAEKSPLVQQMLKTFRGEIADVRRLDRD